MGGCGEERKGFPSYPPPPPTPSFIFWLSFHFSSDQNRKSRSSSFLGLSLLQHHTETLATRTSLSVGGSCYLKSEDRCNAALSVNWVDPAYLNITGPSCSKVNSAIHRINYYQNHYNYRNRPKEVKFVQFSGNDNISFSRPGYAFYPPDKSLSRG